MTTGYRIGLLASFAALTLVGCATTPAPTGEVRREPSGARTETAAEIVPATHSERELLPGETPDPVLAQVLKEKGLSQLAAQRTSVRKQEGQELLAMSVDLDRAAITLPPPKDEDEIRIHVLPVGAGACHLVECPGARSTPMLVECGSTKAAPGVDWSQATVLDYPPGARW